jgi:lysophospholipase L1-like esterase
VHRRIAAPVVACALVAIAAACSTTGQEQSAPRISAAKGSTPNEGPQSIVQLGDSIASGEGTLYGYTYDTKTRSWTGGDVNAQWPLPHPDCHVSPDAYGTIVAQAFDAQLHQFACTGASFDVGIAGPMQVGNVLRRPAEFGNWDKQTDLNADYDVANPDLVLVTLGADDVDFGDIVEDCVKNAYSNWWNPKKYPRECVEENPGPSVQQHFVDVLPQVKKNYGTLVDWIEARAKENGVPVPKIVFTNYADPLPGDPSADCPDAHLLYADQLTYLDKLLGQMNQMITSTITGLGKDNVALADISKAYVPGGTDHRWCSDDPWAYGLSIYSFSAPSSFSSLAPFHPTPAGQKSIAEGVIATVTLLFGTLHPVDTTTTTAGEVSTTSSSTSTSTPPDSTTSTSDPDPGPDPGPDPDPGDGPDPGGP